MSNSCLATCITSPGAPDARQSGTPAVCGAKAVSLSPNRLSMVGTVTSTSRSDTRKLVPMGFWINVGGLLSITTTSSRTCVGHVDVVTSDR